MQYSCVRSAKHEFVLQCEIWTSGVVAADVFDQNYLRASSTVNHL